jgi:glycolate oxidase
MGIAFNTMELDLFKTIKKSFDPNNILNPGKMGLPN